MKYKQEKGAKGLEKYLGKIERVNFGINGYQDCMFGLSVSLSFNNSGVCDDIMGGWAYGVIDPDEHTKWTEETRTLQMAEMCKTVCEIMNDAKVKDIQSLKGKPVEVTMENFNEIKSWRILTEVL